MIKPSQIREKEFSSSTMGGYKKADVDSFLDEVAVSYEQLYKENSELLKKLRLLVDNIEEYRRREQSGSADNADDTLAHARAQADRIIADARQQAEQIIADAEDTAAQAAEGESVDAIRALREKEEAALAAIRDESEKFRKSLLAMYTEHLTLIQSMVGGTPPKKTARAEKSHETKLDIGSMEVDGEFAIDDIDAFFAEAVSDEQGRIKEAFGGFRFEMGIDSAQDEQPTAEAVSDFEEPAAEEEQIQVHTDVGPVADEQPEDSDTVRPGFRISFPEDEDAGDSEEENLDDLFAGFFNPGDKPE